MSCRYTNTLKAEFGRKISAEEANEQFVAIEAAMACLEALAGSSTSNETDIHDYGTVTNETVLDPAFGNMQKITIEGTVNLGFDAPDDADPRVIFLLIADGDGAGKFVLPTGATWTTSSHGASISGVPWDPDSLGGDYGAVVVSFYDGIGWLYMVFARNEIDFTGTLSAVDLYTWR